jgi:hypothetical protein
LIWINLVGRRLRVFRATAAPNTFTLAGAASRGSKLTHAEMRYGDIGRSGVRRKSQLQALMMLKRLAERN